MLYDVMEEINNHFIRTAESGKYEIESDGVVGNFSETYIDGIYLMILGSFKNDGIYKILNVTDNKITVNSTLEEEPAIDTILLYACTPPKSFINLVSEIENYNEKIGVKSESVKNYSVSFGKQGGEWEEAFSNKLNKYRKVFDDKTGYLNYKPQNHLW